MNIEYLNLLKSLKEWDYSRKEKNGGNEPVLVTVTWECHNETPHIAVLNKHIIFQK
jgi:hypothetical protein